MAITTNAELKTAVANWLNRSDLTSRIPEFIALAEDRIGQLLRVRAMETSANLTVNAQSVALPTRYVAMRRLYISATPNAKLDFVTPLNFWEKYDSSQTGQPEKFTIEGENILFWPTPDTSYTGKILYYARFAALSADADTNWLLTNARGLLLYGALVEASPYVKNDARTLTWATMFDQLLGDVIAADKRDRFSGDALTVQSDVLGQ